MTTEIVIFSSDAKFSKVDKIKEFDLTKSGLEAACTGAKWSFLLADADGSNEDDV